VTLTKYLKDSYQRQRQNTVIVIKDGTQRHCYRRQSTKTNKDKDKDTKTARCYIVNVTSKGQLLSITKTKPQRQRQTLKTKMRLKTAWRQSVTKPQRHASKDSYLKDKDKDKDKAKTKTATVDTWNTEDTKTVISVILYMEDKERLKHYCKDKDS
jgi:hypothetical protein